MDSLASLDIGALVQDFLTAASAQQAAEAELPVVAEFAYGLDQAVSDFLDQQGMQVDAYGEVEQQLLGALAHDLEDQAGIDPQDLLDAAQNAFDTHAVLDAFSQHWPDGMAEAHHDGGSDAADSGAI